MTTPVIDLRGVSKDYRGLRPLRIDALIVLPGERVALVGFDAAAAEIFVNLVTGATLPDRGDVRAFGRLTRDIEDGDRWLAFVDRFGMVSARAVLLDQLTVAQNIAMPFTLDLDVVPAEIASRVGELAREAGLDPRQLERRLADVPPGVRARASLARALALDPDMLLLEHPTALLDVADQASFASDLVALVRGRSLATLTLTADQAFAAAVAERVLIHDASTGGLAERGAWRRLLGF